MSEENTKYPVHISKDEIAIINFAINHTVQWLENKLESERIDKRVFGEDLIERLLFFQTKLLSLQDFSKYQVELPQEFKKVLNDNLNDLYAKSGD